MKKYAIFKMSSNGQGGYDLFTMVSNLEPTENKQNADEVCRKMNEFKPDSWHYFQVFEINEKGQALSPSSGEIIYH